VVAVILAGVLVLGLATLARRPRDIRRWAPPVAVAAVTAAFTGLLASWWSTFGWIAWGPRLTLPLLPALVVAAGRAGPQPAGPARPGLVGGGRPPGAARHGGGLFRRVRRGAGGRGVDPAGDRPAGGAAAVVPRAQGPRRDDSRLLLRLRPRRGVARRPAVALG